VSVRRLGLVLALIAWSVLASCAPARTGSRAASTPLEPRPRTSSSAGAAEAEIAPARSHAIATLENKTLGPLIARQHSAGLVAWIARAEKSGGEELVVVPLAEDGAPLRDARVVARVPQEATAFVVEPAGGTLGGWFVAWSALLDRGESLTVVGLTPDGAVRGAAADIQRTNDHIRWLQVVPTANGGLCLWAEETTAGDANVLSVGIDVDATPHGMPARVARGVDGWQAVATGDGAGLALVAVGPVDDRRRTGGSLTWQRLDADGHPQGGSVLVTRRPTVTGDVEVVAIQHGWLMAWTDRTGEDPQVILAAVDVQGHVRGPVAAMKAVGGSSLVSLAEGPSGVALAWEEPHSRVRSTRELHLALVSTASDLVARPVTSLEIASTGAPELVATESGFAILAPARACFTKLTAACTGPTVPTFARLDGSLNAVQTEPLFTGDTHAPSALGWGLRCGAGDRCFAMAAPSTEPTPIYTVSFAVRESPYSPPLAKATPAGAPRVTGVETIASGLAFADLAAAQVGDATLVATLTDALDLPRTRRRSRGGQIVLRPVDSGGAPLGPARTLTSRAVSTGGIALAAGPPSGDDALIAWVSRDDGDPEVHVARVDRMGHTTREARLTDAAGDASSVAVAWAGDGWLIGWVDGRNGNGEVYAAKVDRDLRRIGRDERLTRAPGDAGDVALAVRDGVAWVAWSDPRDSPREGVADIFATTLHPEDATRASDEVRIRATASHSRSPSLAALPGGEALLAWIEDTPSGVDAAGAAMVARIDASAHVIGVPEPLPFPRDQRPTDVLLDAQSDGVRAVVAHGGRDGLTLDALRLAADGTPVTGSSTLLDLDAPSSFDVALAVVADAIVFDDVGQAPGDHRIRRAAVDWRP
jgi:hypothetical protein